MKLTCMAALPLHLAAVTAAPAVAREKRAFLVINESAGVPVFAHDLADHRYDVVGQVKAKVRLTTILEKPSRAKIYRELWERAERLGADAVINAGYSGSRINMTSWNTTDATGTAVRFRTAGESPEC